LAVLMAYPLAVDHAKESAFLYVAPTLARTQYRPPDLVLCHPETGLVIFEAKGHAIDEIEGIEAGYLKVHYHNRFQSTNVIRQSEDQLYEVQSAIGRLLPDRRNQPLINALIAFPNIAMATWRERSYDQLMPTDVLLFAEALADPQLLRQQVDALVRQALAMTGKSNPIAAEHWQPIAQVFGNSDVINCARPIRSTVDEAQLGALIDEVQSAENYLSEEQKALVQLRVDGFPRLIRGVAGSGKTVVLAELAARFLHRHYPEERVCIGVTCFNRALVPFLAQKIAVAWQGHGHSEPMPAAALRITHLNGLLWLLIQEGWPLQYLPIRSVPDATVRARTYRNQIANFARSEPSRYHAMLFDALFVDEAQDLATEEIGLLLDLIKPNADSGEKTLVLCYDDAQNLYGRPRPVWREVGINVAIGDRSRVMRQCHRNGRQTVELALNVLLGSAAPPDLRVHTRQYADLAYLREHNLVTEERDHVRVHFALREDLPPTVQTFPLRHAELDWVVEEVVQLIVEEAVRPEDILLLAHQPRSPEFDLPYLDRRLRERLPTIALRHVYGEQRAKDDYLLVPGQLTLATVFSAKGYDAPVVFVMGADLFPYTKEGRAAFYVAATRAKLRLFISGLWRDRSLLGEADQLRRTLVAGIALT
ncbi:MAG: hypothetical protein KDE53_28390, partial [Caldilineaceae bacterium]|nr:hypothetical protein [Caldilineaceae bacterium]